VLRLVEAGVDDQIRETFRSAVAFGEAVLVDLGMPEDEAAALGRRRSRVSWSEPDELRHHIHGAAGGGWTMMANGGSPEIPRAMAYVPAVLLIVGAGLFLLTPFGVMPLP
jgi:glutathione-regulated potassium-efflux system protein KefB